MSYPTDTVAQIKQLAEEGESECGIERHTGISRAVIRWILGKGNNNYMPVENEDLSTRQRQKLLNWRMVR